MRLRALLVLSLTAAFLLTANVNAFYPGDPDRDANRAYLIAQVGGLDITAPATLYVGDGAGVPTTAGTALEAVLDVFDVDDINLVEANLEGTPADDWPLLFHIVISETGQRTQWVAGDPPFECPDPTPLEAPLEVVFGPVADQFDDEFNNYEDQWVTSPVSRWEDPTREGSSATEFIPGVPPEFQRNIRYHDEDVKFGPISNYQEQETGSPTYACTEIKHPITKQVTKIILGARVYGIADDSN